MNEIITKLNEIEEKADAILLDAKNEKERHMAQLARDKQEIDACYDRIEKEHAKAMREQLMAKARAQTETAKEETRTACEQLFAYYGEQKEHLAEEIMNRVIQ